ncbi:unnamed protein product [Lasius platythorax]|uniref:Gustatory receptor n=1 Tax=Lasius platythorax TaxID=488582 RepID=A0AAV2N8B8_9HYME
MKNIQAAIRPLSIVLCLCGVGVFEYPEGRPRLCLTILYILLSRLSYTYFIIRAMIFFNNFEIDLPMITTTYIMYISFAIAYILFSLYYNKKYKSCLNKLNIVTDTLEKLGTPNNYTKLRMRIKWLIIGWIFLIFFLNMLDSVCMIGHVSKSYIVTSIFHTLILNHMFYIIMLYDLTFMILLRYIESQFDHINQHIQELMEEKKRRVKHTWAISSSLLIRRHMPGTKTSQQIIWILMHVHLELCSISRELNTVFGFPMVMQTTILQIASIQFVITFYKAVMMINTYSMYLMAMNILTTLAWAITNIIKMITFNYICEGIYSKASRAELYLNKLTNLNIDVETQNNIMQFLLQLLRRPLRISGLGFYVYGYNFIQWLIRNVATITIIVIQTQAFEKY